MSRARAATAALAAALLGAPLPALAAASCPDGVVNARLWGYGAGTGDFIDPDVVVTDPPDADMQAELALQAHRPIPKPRMIRIEWLRVRSLQNGPSGAQVQCTYASRPPFVLRVPADADTCTLTPGQLTCR